jgi:hypothetical protein
MFDTLRKFKRRCAVCEGQMDHVTTIPAAPNLPELLHFRCRSCGSYKTVEGSLSSADADDRAA